MHRDTEILHAGYGAPGAPGAFQPGPQFASTYATPGDPAQYPLTYGREQNPTWSAWEAALGALDGGESVAFASGMAATNAVFGVMLPKGSVLVLPDDSYFTTRLVASRWLEQRGVTVRLAPTRGNGQGDVLEGATLLLLETPSNPSLAVCDIAALAALARSRGCATAVDNTTATGFLQRPLALGADVVISSDTKAMTGHSDLVLGHVSTADPALAGQVRTWRTQHGAIPGPMEVWLAHRSLATLPLRLARQCDTALQLANRLAHHPAVVGVRYPGLPTHEGHAIAAKQMAAFGSVLSFDLGSQAAAEAFFGALTLVRESTSFGGVHSSAERRARWGGDAVGPGFIRFSTGCEHPGDLIGDVLQALDAAPR